MRVKVVKLYKDLQLNRLVNIGETIEVTEDRFKTLSSRGFVELLRETATIDKKEVATCREKTSTKVKHGRKSDKQ